MLPKSFPLVWCVGNAMYMSLKSLWTALLFLYHFSYILFSSLWPGGVAHLWLLSCLAVPPLTLCMGPVNMPTQNSWESLNFSTDFWSFTRSLFFTFRQFWHHSCWCSHHFPCLTVCTVWLLSGRHEAHTNMNQEIVFIALHIFKRLFCKGHTSCYFCPKEIFLRCPLWYLLSLVPALSDSFACLYCETLWNPSGVKTVYVGKTFIINSRSQTCLSVSEVSVLLFIFSYKT